MMMLEDASRLAAACHEVAPPEHGMLYARLEIAGEPDVGAVVETVQRDAARSDLGEGPFSECVTESLFMLSLAPPTEGGTQSLTLFFDASPDGVVVGKDDPRQPQRAED
jgi:hypothetical protein